MSQKGAIHLLLPVIILVTISLVALGKMQTTTKFDDSNVQGIIAENDDNRAGKPSNMGASSEEIRSKQEIRTSNEKIKNDTREDRTKIDVSRDKVINKTEIDDDDVDIEDEASKSAGETENEDIQELRAISKFPLRIDVSTNQLIMTKNGVERVLTTLPAQAVQNMLRAHLKKGLGPKFFQATPSAIPSGTPSASPEEPIASESADVTVLEDKISLEEVSGQIVYKIPAKKKLRLFGFIPITTDMTGFVSAQTGVLIEEKQSLLSRILDLLSP